MISMGGWLIISGILLANGSLAAVVAVRNSKASINRIFLVLLLLTSVWAVSSAVSDSTQNYSLARYASFIAFGAGFLSVSWAYLFSVYFRFPEFKQRHYIFIVISTIVGILYSTPLVYNLKSLDVYENGFLYVPYLVSIFIVLLLTIRNYLAVIKTGNALKKNHARLMLIGVTATIVLAIVTNAVIPLIIQVTWTTTIGPLFTIIFISSIAYSIVRHKLFDIRAIAARALAYVLAMALTVFIYTVIVFGVIENIFNLAGTSVTTKAVYSVMAIVLAITFGPIKIFFDKVTTSIFYRDDYNINQVLDTLNEKIVESSALSTLANGSLRVISDAVKPEFATIQLIGENETIYKHFSVGSHSQKVSESAIAASSGGHLLLVSNELSEDVTHGLLLSQARIDVAIALKTSRKSIGYLMLGFKQNGSAYRKKDIDLITVAADELALAIQNTSRFEEIKKFNETLQARINSATAELRISNRKLHLLDKSKDEFISMASHQLRTPLTSVKGYISMVLEGDMGKISPQQREVLEQAYDSSQRMVFLIGDFLNVSRIQTGKFEMEPSTINFTNLVAEEVDQLKETAKMHRMKLVYEKPVTDHIAVGDENKLRQVMMNFIDNAIYYSPTGSSIAVHLYKETAGLVFKVVDQGIGVPKEAQSKLFTKFFRASNARQQRPDGTGIGLYMAKKVIVAHGGSIIFETKEGVGSTFGFKLPLEKELQQSGDEQSSTANNSGRNSS